MKTFEQLQRAAHHNSRTKGFWDDPELNTPGVKIALMHSELSELLEAYREDPEAHCGKEGCQLTCEQEEVADLMLRLMDWAERRGIDILKCAWEKHRYNETRPRMHGKKTF